jgi:hypothetical protein
LQKWQKYRPGQGSLKKLPSQVGPAVLRVAEKGFSRNGLKTLQSPGKIEAH